jgi:hypothetical protein
MIRSAIGAPPTEFLQSRQVLVWGKTLAVFNFIQTPPGYKAQAATARPLSQGDRDHVSTLAFQTRVANGAFSACAEQIGGKGECYAYSAIA